MASASRASGRTYSSLQSPVSVRAKTPRAELETTLRLLKTDYVDIWQMHEVQAHEEIDRMLGPNGAMEAFEAAKKAGKAGSSVLPGTSIPTRTRRC